MSAFYVTVRTVTLRVTYIAISPSAIAAYMNAAYEHGDTPCGITVKPVGGAL